MSLTDDLKKNYSAMEGQLNDRSKELLRFYGKTAKSLDASITELFQKYEIDGVLTYEEMQKFNRLKSFFRQINQEYSKLSGKLLSLTIGSAEETVQEAYARQAWALEQEGKKVNINLAFTLIPMAAVNASVRAVNDSGLNLITTIKKNRANALVRIQEEIQQSLIRGTSLRDIRAKIKQFWDGDAYKAERVLRTETLRVLEEGRKMATDEAREQGLNIRGVWLATLDSRTRDSHAEMDGKKTDDEGQFTLPTGEKVDGPHMTGIAGEDINCIPGYSEILGRNVEKIYRRYYEGKLIRIKTAFGLYFEVTSNHPILTNKGWVKAGLLNKGDDIVSEDFRKRFTISDLNIQNTPTMISEIFDFLKIIFPIETRTGSNKQFHGDGKGGDVDVISINSHLWNCIDAAFIKPIIKLSLSKSNPGKFMLAAFCLFYKTINRLSIFTERFMSFLRKFLSIFKRQSGHAGKHGFTSISDLDTLGIQNPINDLSGMMNLLRQLFNGYPGHVQFDKIVDVYSFDFSGHVYNLQTENNMYGLYNDNGKMSILHNCRCTTLESVDDSMPEQRASGDDTIDYVTYEEWIDQKDLAASQLEKLAG